jgi:hypothetical protein
MVVDGHKGEATTEHRGKRQDDVTQPLRSWEEQEIDDDDDDDNDVPLAVASDKRAKGLRSGGSTRKVCVYAVRLS